MPAMTLLQLSPEKYIEFPSVRMQSVSVNLSLKNVSGSPVAYKIKTTAPKSYLVRPSSGIIASGEEQDVQIVLQPQPNLPANNVDRFLVQATEIESTSVAVAKDFWTTVSKQLLQDQRLGVMFKPEEGSSVTTAPVNISSIAASPSPFTTVADMSQSSTDIRRPAGPPPSGSSDFEAKYNDLLQYCLAVEKQKGNLTKDLDGVRQKNEILTQKIGSALCRNCGGKIDTLSGLNPQSGGYQGQKLQQGFELWQVIAMVVGVVIVLKVFNLL